MTNEQMEIMKEDAYLVDSGILDTALERARRHEKEKGGVMAKISYIKVCKVCNHYNPDSKGFCSTLGKAQVVNVANDCPHFSGEKYKFNYDKACIIGERPSTFSK